MLEIITNYVYNNLTYYNVIIILSLIIGLASTYYHETGIPILWTSVLSLVMVIGKEYLEPILLGILNFDVLNYSILSIMLASLSILLLLIIGVTHLNLILYGEAVQ